MVTTFLIITIIHAILIATGVLKIKDENGKLDITLAVAYYIIVSAVVVLTIIIILPVQTRTYELESTHSISELGEEGKYLGYNGAKMERYYYYINSDNDYKQLSKIYSDKVYFEENNDQNPKVEIYRANFENKTLNKYMNDVLGKQYKYKFIIPENSLKIQNK